MSRFIILPALLFLLTTACKTDFREESTRVMADSLQLISNRATPKNYPYANSLAAAEIGALIAGVPYNSPTDLRLVFARNLVYAGNFEQGILELEKVIDARFGEKSLDQYSKPYYELLAIAYLRLGEQENCVMNHTSKSCLLPISDEGIHQNRRGSENAILYFEKLLAYDSADMQSRWLLNIAYMTLGEYPENVPANYRIPDSVFASDISFPVFVDRAIGLGIDHTALAGGCITEDFNNDGFLDIFATSWGLSDQVKLWISDGNGGYSDWTENAGLSGITGGLNTIQADYDNDGYTDIFIMRGGWLKRTVAQPNSLLRNLGNGKFRDVTREAGLYSRYPTQTAVWTDLNVDGHIDLFIGNDGILARYTSIRVTEPLLMKKTSGCMRSMHLLRVLRQAM